MNTLTAQPFHPAWCSRRFCSAYDTSGQGESAQYHRSEPTLNFNPDDPQIAIYIHLSSDPDGEDPCVEIIEHEAPINGVWWYPVDTPEFHRILPLDRAQRFQRAIAKLIAKATPPDPTAAEPHT